MPPMVVASFVTHIVNAVLTGQSPFPGGFAALSSGLVQLLTLAGLL